jgi:hypothetical protein
MRYFGTNFICVRVSVTILKLVLQFRVPTTGWYASRSCLLYYEVRGSNLYTLSGQEIATCHTLSWIFGTWPWIDAMMISHSIIYLKHPKSIIFPVTATWYTCTHHYYKTGFCWLDFMTWTYNMTNAFYSQTASKNGPIAQDIYDWWSRGPGRSLWHVSDGIEVYNIFGTALETSINLTARSQVHMPKASHSVLLLWTSTSHVVLVVFVTVCSQSIYSFTMQLWLNTIIW